MDDKLDRADRAVWPREHCTEMENQIPPARIYSAAPGNDTTKVVGSAFSWEVSLCGQCNNVHLWLLNPDGEYFAAMTMNEKTFNLLDTEARRLFKELKARRQ